jgi:hypothetical protein
VIGKTHTGFRLFFRVHRGGAHVLGAERVLGYVLNSNQSAS